MKRRPTNVDFGRAALDYARYRAGFPASFHDALVANGIVPHVSRDRALDIATGTGTIARSLAARGWRVDGIDRSADMLAAARMLAAEDGVEIALQVAPAEALPFPEPVFALAAAGTCWHWFDRARAATEAHRVLMPGGHLVVAALEWRSAAGNAIQATEDLIIAHNPDWGAHHDDGNLVFDFAWADDLETHGFGVVDRQRLDVDIPYTHEAWRGRIRASAGVGASLSPDDVARFDAELAALLARDFPADPLVLPHAVMMIVARRD